MPPVQRQLFRFLPCLLIAFILSLSLNLILCEMWFPERHKYLWHGAFHRHSFSRNGMGERKREGVQPQTPDWIPGCTVFPISDDGTPDLSQVDPDLMLSSRLDPDLKQGMARKPSPHLVMSNRTFSIGIFGRRIDGMTATFHQPAPKGASRLGRMPFDQSDV